jgi:hypothetical protein
VGGYNLSFSLFRKLLAQARERGVADLSTDRDYNQLVDRVNKTLFDPFAVSCLSNKTSTKHPNFFIQKLILPRKETVPPGYPNCEIDQISLSSSLSSFIGHPRLRSCVNLPRLPISHPLGDKPLRTACACGREEGDAI